MTDINRLIYGKNSIERIVGCEVKDSSVELFIQQSDGSVKSEFKPNKFWIVADRKLDVGFQKLQGNLFYNHIKFYESRDEFLAARNIYYHKNTFSIFHPVEAAQVKNGFTYYKNLKLQDLTVLSFDIETTSLEHNDSAKVLIITNTLRINGVVTRKMFLYNEYPSQGAMIQAWCEWVKEVDPSVLVFHNGIIYDLPYLEFVASRENVSLNLGRDGSTMQIDSRESKFRKDGSQFYTYKKLKIYGRELVDTFFLSLKYDVARKYENYKLKQIIKQEGLEVKNRQFYDGDLIRHNYQDPQEWPKIIKYAKHDGDDALALFDLMAPSIFYFTQSVPKPFQLMIESATGSQLNSMMIRSYLQDNHSIPKDSPAKEYEGAISLGNPGVYKNVLKWDVASLYPSIILTHNIYDKVKDPNGNFLKMVRHFTEERLRNKKLAKETGERHYKDLEQSQKIGINSAYGFLGATGLLFNSPANAAFITEEGRNILTDAIQWAESKGFKIANADTDSISVCFNNESFTEEDQEALLGELNSLFPDSISWEADGYFKNVLVIKAKNYYLETQEGKTTIKGSALKATMKAPALQQFIKEFMQLIIDNGDLVSLYNIYVKKIIDLKDLKPWCTKKTVTTSVLNPERSNEQNILDAMENADEEFQEGDKIHVYFSNNPEQRLKLLEHWENDHDRFKLIENLWKTVKIFETVIDIKQFPKYHLKKQRVLLDNLTNLT